MAILFYHLDLNAVGGAEQYVRDVIQGCVSAGRRVVLASEAGRRGTICGAPVHPLHRTDVVSRGYRRIRRALQPGYDSAETSADRLLRRCGTVVDAVVCGHFKLLRSAHAVAAALNVPLILVVYGIDIWREWTDEERRLLEQCTAVVALSEYTHESVAGRLGRSGAVTVIHPGVDARFFCPAPDSTADSRPTILTTARLAGSERYKGHDLVIGSLPSLVKDFPALRYDVVGDGSDRQRLEGLAAAAGVSRNVVFHGVKGGAALRDAYRACTMFVMPSYVSVDARGTWTGEGFGIVYAEAGACGKPSIGCDVGGQVDIIEDRVTGRTVRPAIEELADAIRELLADRTLAAALGEAARRKVVESFDYPVFHRKWASLFSSVGL